MDKLPKRKQNRLKEYDYCIPGHYFVTICTQDCVKIFGTIENNQMILNGAGNMIDFWWQEMFKKYKNISIDKYIIMPNHIRGIINIVGAALCSRPLINPYIGPIQNNKNNIIGDKNHINTGENMVSPLQYNGLGQYIS